jgi:hypothetical protein
MTLVDRSEDLRRLVEEGFDVEIRDGNLLVHHIPYVTQSGDVAYGVLVSELTTDGEKTVRPGGHDVRFIGEIPHDHQGNKHFFIISEDQHDYGGGLVASCQMSGKRHNEHPPDYYVKITTYASALGRPARAIDSTAWHTDYPVRETTEDESVFLYHDAATSRSGLSAVTGKLKLESVAIVGLGGTGSYILDLVAKTPVREVHLYDDDEILAHNAFRAPGAASIDELRPGPKKVDYLGSVYSKMRRGIVSHPVRISEDNVAELRTKSFVFVAIDAGPAKKVILDNLREWAVPFVDCGMGLHRVGNALRGSVRTTAGSPGRYDHIDRRISYADVMADEYDFNLQTADLNMLNAAMAVLRWKKHLGYYEDSRGEHHAVYSVSSNLLVNGEEAE